MIQPGDFGLTHSGGSVPVLIRWGEFLRLKWKRIPNAKQLAHWNHAVLVTEVLSDGNLKIIQAESSGVGTKVIDPISPSIIFFDSKLDDRGRQLAVAFARTALDRPYGFLAIVGIIATLLTPNLFNFQKPGTFICSGLVARALEHGGYTFPMNMDYPDQIMPAELAVLFKEQDETT